MKELAVSIKNLSFSYEQNNNLTLNRVSFDIQKGEYVTLIGHNGSGKSTITKLLCGLISPRSGTILINGKNISDKKNYDLIRRSVGIVFQNPDNQFIGTTVEDDIAFGLENRNVEYSKMKELVLEYSKKVGMYEYLHKQPSELSGGQKQRVAIAGILALNLEIIIFDEATSMLDPKGIEEIKTLISNMKKENPNLTIISITHDMEEAYKSDRTIVLNNGEIYKDGNFEDIFESEEEIKSIGLDLPFVMKVKYDLKNKGINIPKKIKTVEELSKYICK